jgi:hypothetical protein
MAEFCEFHDIGDHRHRETELDLMKFPEILEHGKQRKSAQSDYQCKDRENLTFPPTITIA